MLAAGECGFGREDMKVLHGKLIAAAILAAASLPAALAQVPAGQPAFAVTYIEVAPSGDLVPTTSRARAAIRGRRPRLQARPALPASSARGAGHRGRADHALLWAPATAVAALVKNLSLPHPAGTHEAEYRSNDVPHILPGRPCVRIA